MSAELTSASNNAIVFKSVVTEEEPCAMTTIIVQCPSCLTAFELDPLKLPAAGVRASCSVCSAVITVPPLNLATGDSADVSTATPTVSAGEAIGFETNSATTPTSAPIPTSTPDFTSVSTSSSGEFKTVPDTPTVDVASAATVVEGDVLDTHQQEAEPIRIPEIPRRRPINPFLARDPALRAKRLARALVSDIVAYHPAKHAEGLRDGSLKTLFRDEIRKSYDEYVDQVGREFANSTTHFHDALNDVLASGKKLF